MDHIFLCIARNILICLFFAFCKKHEFIFLKNLSPAQIQFKYDIRNLGFEHIHLLLLAILAKRDTLFPHMISNLNFVEGECPINCQVCQVFKANSQNLWTGKFSVLFEVFFIFETSLPRHSNIGVEHVSPLNDPPAQEAEFLLCL